MAAFDFREQLKLGSRGEELFQQYYPRRLEPAKDLTYDFLVSSSRQKIELKTDSYNMDKTPNFFMERYSDVRRRTPGGPWRAEKDEIHIFCYYFVRHNTWFEFRDVPALVRELKRLTSNARMMYVRNKTWVSGGFLVPRELLRDYYTEWTFPTEGTDEVPADEESGKRENK